MGIFDSNKVKTQEYRKDVAYWVNRTTDVGGGVQNSVAGFDKIKVVISSIVNSASVISIRMFVVKLGDVAGNLFAIAPWELNGAYPPTVLQLKSTGVYEFDINVREYSTIGFEAGFVGTGSVSLSYTLLGDSSNADSNIEDQKLSRSKFSKIFENNSVKAFLFDEIIFGSAIYKDIFAYANSAGTVLNISSTKIEGTLKAITVDNTNFPNLISGSIIHRVLIMPYTRNLTTMMYPNGYRIIVIMNKGQIYHNFPSRAVGSDGASLTGDIYLFDESVIFDMEGRKFPSSTIDSSDYYLFPCLPAESYNPHPALNVDNGFGHGGWGISITKTCNAPMEIGGSTSRTFRRFYIPQRSGTQNPFVYMGGYDYNTKVVMLGTYLSNSSPSTSTRLVVIASHDGREWFVKYEFGERNTANQSWGNNIITSGIGGVGYTADSFSIKKRTVVVPNNTTKEPTNIFGLGASIVVSSITKADPAVVTTTSPHGLTDGDSIIFIDNPSSGGTSSDFDWMRNDSHSLSDAGNGILFKINYINSTSFSLKEFIHNPYNNLSALHIHSINSNKDGFVIATGETYPDGWILYCPIIESDAFALKRGFDDMNFYRLNSSADSAQRPLGIVLKDDSLTDPTLIFASDNETTTRNNLTIPDRTLSIVRSSTGVYSGKLSEIDDFSKFNCIYETNQVCYFFKEILDTYIFIGQLGELALSFDKGITWQRINIGDRYENFSGIDSLGRILINRLLIIIK